MGSLNVMKIVTMKKNLNGPKIAKYKKIYKTFYIQKYVYYRSYLYKIEK